MTTKTFRSVALVLMGFVVVQLGFRAFHRQTGPTAGQYIRAPFGEALRTQITESGVQSTLSHLSLGRCAIVAIVSVKCGACKSAARAWRDDSEAEGGLPEGWEVIWVAVEGTEDELRAFLPAGFPYRTASSSREQLLEEGVEVWAYPSHLILDRDGRIVSADVGVRFPDRTRLTDSCSIEAGA